MKSHAIRTAFLEYFQQHQHTLVPSSSLVPAEDPTLLFTNAGMVQFKDTFLGQEKRTYQRAVSAQRCVRAGGKHNDLENVGYTARHHTFFEMLGNFSFGDYFKRHAIHMAWEFLTRTLKIPAEKLWVTVYLDDDEAADIWINDIGVPRERLSRCDEKDNFWSMGDVGPCGPCTEIFYDHGPSIPGGPPGSAEADLDRYIEIWNIVFMQYNRDPEGTLHPLPNPSVDTGMGLERIAAVLQGVHNNYDTDIFVTLIDALHTLAPATDRNNPSFRVIADHIRTCAFLISDGVLPGNEGRAYVLRRIMRRAIRHGHKLTIPSPFLDKLLTPLAQAMGAAYPALIEQQASIATVLRQEEEQFARTLEQGMQILQTRMEQLHANKILPGDVVFKLYDTYGFPVDLTQDIAREYNWTVDMSGFEACMQKQRHLSQSASQFTQDYLDASLASPSIFHGYTSDRLAAHIMGIMQDNKTLTTLENDKPAVIILDATPFYAESGGQVGDRGWLRSAHAIFTVHDTKKMGETILHYGQLTKGTLITGETLEAEIDILHRDAIRLNHTATHLVHAALKQTLGNHVQQKGSLVDAARARFDFAHHEALTPAQIKTIECSVNEHIRLNHPVETEIMDIEDARASGAMALFGEKYNQSVRVLSMGSYSKELCGGTHAARTGDIGLFKITAEYGVASGVRRIEIVTGAYALAVIHAQEHTLLQVAGLLKTTPQEVEAKLEQLIHQQKTTEKERDAALARITALSSQSLLDNALKIGNIQLLIESIPHADAKILRDTLDQLRSALEQSVIVLYAIDNGNISVIAGVSNALISKTLNAPTVVKLLCGRGGGRPDMAQGGAPVPDDLDDRIQKIHVLLSQESS